MLLDADVALARSRNCVLSHLLVRHNEFNNLLFCFERYEQNKNSSIEKKKCDRVHLKMTNQGMGFCLKIKQDCREKFELLLLLTQNCLEN